MKLKFKNQEFQTDAVNAVVELFAGQERTHNTFSVEVGGQDSLFGNLGFGNVLRIDENALTENMQAIQKKNGLPLTDDAARMNFCVEMETGTGKTYVYSKTIFELNRQYGFTKFIIVVPSVAIREGVYKSFQITKEHFGLEYDNIPYRFFIYNSQKLSDVRQFAAATNIEIMIINIDAFRKSENVINQEQDRLGGDTAMRYIQDTCPIVIIDEPQSVDNTPKAQDAIASLHPLCVLRYSATHRNKINLLYRLTPVDAYQMGLVKQISVFSNQVFGGYNQPYIKLLSVTQDKGFRARIEMDVRDKNGIVGRKALTVRQGADLYQLSGKRELYDDGYIITGIDCTPGREHIEFQNTEELALGKAIGSVDDMVIKRAQIRRTIETHLDKELRYLPLGIKVLSLFFIDKVELYRHADGTPGQYAKMFEDCYQDLISRPKYAPLRERFYTDVSAMHNGYFSQDKKGRLKDTKGDTAADYDAYQTIMRDKEWLLSFDCPLRFIFSHSTLKEGWDNPNVFQICTLIDQKSVFTCRQKVGRGLRLCVNQDGERVEDRDINVLHVMANESFSEFADTLQREIEEDTGIRFGVLEYSLFAGMVYEEKRQEETAITREQAEQIVEDLQTAGIVDSAGTVLKPQPAEDLPLPERMQEARPVIQEVLQKAETVTPDTLTGQTYTATVTEEKTFSESDAKELIAHLEKRDYISKSGAIKDTMKNALKAGTLDLPAKFEAAKKRILQIAGQQDRRPVIRDASRDVTVRLNKQMLISPEFMELWNRIRQKTTYRVQINSQKLMEDCITAIRDMEPIPAARILTQTADLRIETSGIRHVERETRTTEIADNYRSLPNLLTSISSATLMKASTICKILDKSGRLGDFLRNPEAFLERVTEIIQKKRKDFAVDGIKYEKLEGEEYYWQQVFSAEEISANLDINALEVAHR